MNKKMNTQQKINSWDNPLTMKQIFMYPILAFGLIFLLAGIFAETFPTVPKTPEQIAEEIKKEAQEKIDSAAQNIRLSAISAAQSNLEEALRDPDSVEYIVKSYNLDNNALCFKYRAKNGFGGFGVETVVFL